MIAETLHSAWRGAHEREISSKLQEALLNDAIIAGERHRFCTALYATIEPLMDGSWRLTSVAGGHPPPIIHRGADRTAFVIGAPGTFLGVFPVLQLTQSVITLLPDDALVMVPTDLECRCAHTVDVNLGGSVCLEKDRCRVSET